MLLLFLMFHEKNEPKEARLMKTATGFDDPNLPAVHK